MQSEQSKIQALLDAFADGLRAPAPVTVTQWAESNRMMSSEDSAERGHYRAERAPFQREPQDRLSASDPCEVVVWMCGSQLMKTTGALNFLGWIIDVDPGPVLYVNPREDDAKSVSKERVAPMIRDSASLKAKVSEVKSRDSNNSILHKSFLGGQVTFVGAISPSGLAARPVRYLICDEVDRYPASAGSEGDPVSLAVQRTATFWNRKILLCSTPTIKGQSRIEKAYAESSQHRYLVPCPHCGHFQILTWDRMVWPEGKPAEAQYRCSGCQELIPNWRKPWMLANGRWEAQNPAVTRVMGYHISGLYSPWAEWGGLAERFVAAAKDPERLKTFTNTVLAETWEERHEVRVDEHVLMNRREAWDKVPAEVVCVTAGVDVQKNRVEVEIVGWGRDEESWSLGYHVIPGDTEKPAIFDELDALLLQSLETEEGDKLTIRAACVDSGYSTAAVYRFTQPRRTRRVFATKGRAGKYPVWPLKLSRGQRGALLVMIGVDSAKDKIYNCLKVDQPGPSYCHFPAERDLEYFEMLTAERVKIRYTNGFAVRSYQKESGQRNEALDARVNAYAALHALYMEGYKLNREADRMSARIAERKKPVDLQKSAILTPLLAAPKPQRIESRDPWL